MLSYLESGFQADARCSPRGGAPSVHLRETVGGHGGKLQSAIREIGADIFAAILSPASANARRVEVQFRAISDTGHYRQC